MLPPAACQFDAFDTLKSGGHAGLCTFPHSTKHVRLYQKFGFYPRYLTVMAALVTSGLTLRLLRGYLELLLTCRLNTGQRQRLDEIYEGLHSCRRSALRGSAQPRRHTAARSASEPLGRACHLLNSSQRAGVDHLVKPRRGPARLRRRGAFPLPPCSIGAAAAAGRSATTCSPRTRDNSTG